MEKIYDPRLGYYNPETGTFSGGDPAGPAPAGVFQSRKEFETGPGIVTDSLGNLYRAQWYPVIMTIPEEYGARVEETAQIGQFEYVATIIAWDQTYPCEQDEQETIPPCLIGQRDGLFYFSFRISDRNMIDQPALIRAIIGDAVGGRPLPLPAPVRATSKETITVSIENRIARTGIPAEERELNISFIGLRKYEGP